LSSLSHEQKQVIKEFLTSKVGNEEFLECLLLANSISGFFKFHKKKFRKISVGRDDRIFSWFKYDTSQRLWKSVSKRWILTAQIESNDQEFVLLGVFAAGCQLGMANWNFKQYQRSFCEIFNQP